MFSGLLGLLLCGAGATGLTEDQAVATAIANSRELIAARLNVDAAEVDRATSTVWTNPVVSYSVSNLVVGDGNPQGAGLKPGFFDQPVHSVGVTQVLDVWLKRGKRFDVADKAVETTRRLAEQVVREVAWAVRSAFADALRAEELLALSTQSRGRYDETVRLSNSRWKAGDISETDYKKIELESFRYRSAELQATLQSGLARQKLVALMALPPAELVAPLVPSLRTFAALDPDALATRALAQRPDVAAARTQLARAQLQVAAQRRELLPDISVGLAYTRDYFVVSGDNPNSLALTVSLPVPVFDRNQNGIGHALVDARAAQNETERLELAVRHEVADATRRAENARTLLELLETEMLSRAEAALIVAEKSFRAGSSSLLELLEAQRTYVELREQYLDASYQYRQATIDVVHAVGGNAS